LTAKIADNNHLFHANMSLPCTIKSDVIGRAIGAVLIQPIGKGATFITSTVSGVLNPTEQRYSDAEQEKQLLFLLYKTSGFTYLGTK
jgi:hypothetical protein